MRFADFAADYTEAFDLAGARTADLLSGVRESLETKNPGDVDSPEIQTIKGLIRRGEAKAACRYVGIPDEQMHFLDMPFYETGTVRKKPIGPEDIKIVSDLLNEVRPHQIFAAGDLSDPHGTHRTCLAAVMEAFRQNQHTDWAQNCWVWLYRGAWQEWSVEETEMAIPISPDELLRKRRAIFKHQSQKDRPLFPGHDTREFWQKGGRPQPRYGRSLRCARHAGVRGDRELPAVAAVRCWIAYAVRAIPNPGRAGFQYRKKSLV